MDSSNNSSNYLFQSGGGIQSQASPGQGSNTSGLQTNGNPLFAGSNGTGQQDILGQASVVGPVEFDSSQLQSNPNESAPGNSNGWVDPLVFVLLVGVVIFVFFGGRHIFRA